MLLLTPGTVHILEVIILLDELLRNSFTRLEVNALPCTDTAVDILERLGVEDGHGSAFLLLSWQVSAVDTSKADSRDGSSALITIVFQGENLQEIRPYETVQAVQLVGIVGHGEAGNSFLLVVP